MFKKHSMQVKFVKDAESEPIYEPQVNVNTEDLIDQTSNAVQDIMTRGAYVVAGYVILDTVRKVAIAYASK